MTAESKAQFICLSFFVVTFGRFSIFSCSQKTRSLSANRKEKCVNMTRNRGRSVCTKRNNIIFLRFFCSFFAIIFLLFPGMRKSVCVYVKNDLMACMFQRNRAVTVACLCAATIFGFPIFVYILRFANLVTKPERKKAPKKHNQMSSFYSGWHVSV